MPKTNLKKPLNILGLLTNTTFIKKISLQQHFAVYIPRQITTAANTTTKHRGGKKQAKSNPREKAIRSTLVFVFLRFFTKPPPYQPITLYFKMQIRLQKAKDL